MMDKISRKSKHFGESRIEIVSLRTPCTEAMMAMDMIVKWGMVAAEEDGEDKAGRQKIKLSSPEELVDRAVKVAELACQRFEEKGWFLALPMPDESDEKDDQV